MFEEILTTILHELTSIQLSEECHTAAKIWQKKFGERPPAKKSIKAAGFSDVFAKNFAQSFHPLDKHNSVKKNFSSKLLNFPRGTFVIIEL